MGLTPTTPETTLISMLKGKMQLLQCEQLQAMLSRKKIEYLKELVSGFEGNTIVFAHNIEYINYLAEQLNTPLQDHRIDQSKEKTGYHFRDDR